MATDWAGTFAVAEALVPGCVPGDLRTLPHRLALDRPAVAVVGLHTRGKSVLFNRLVGAEVSQVSNLPATATCIIASTGPPSAWAERIDGTRIALPCDPQSFRAHVDRVAGAGLARACIVGDFRLPPGLALIDTPGIDDPDALFDDRLTDLGRSWLSSGADGCVCVVAVPPGLAMSDRRIIEEAARTFPDASATVLKRTSSDVSEEDLNDVRDAVARLDGLDLDIVPDASSSGRWRTGPLQVVERLIDRIAADGNERRDVDVLRAEELVASVARGLDAGTGGTAALARAAALPEGNIDRRLHRALSDACERARIASLDARAQAIIDSAPALPSSILRRSDLLAQARDGSPVARRALVRFVEQRPAQPLDALAPALVDALPTASAAEVIGRGLLGASDLLLVATSAADEEVRVAAVDRLGRTPLTPEQINRLATMPTAGADVAARRAYASACRVLAEELDRERRQLTTPRLHVPPSTKRVLVRSLALTNDVDLARARGGSADTLTLLHRAHRAVLVRSAVVVAETASDTITRCWSLPIEQFVASTDPAFRALGLARRDLAPLALLVADSREVDDILLPVELGFARRVAPNVEARIDHLMGSPAPPAAPVRAELAYFVGVGQIVVDRVGRSRVPMLAASVVRARTHAGAVAATCDAKRSDRLATNQRLQTGALVSHLSSYIVAVVAILLSGTEPEVASWFLLASIVIWTVSVAGLIGVVSRTNRLQREVDAFNGR